MKFPSYSSLNDGSTNPSEQILKSLGYANSWGDNVPDIVKNCKHTKKHNKTIERNVMAVTCEICGYTYKVDSSD